MWIRTLTISSLLVAWGVANADAQNFTQRGTRRGAVAGAVVGGLIGGNNDRPALGIVVGGVSGALIGRAIGQQRDQQFYQNNYGYQNFNQYNQPTPYGQGQYYSPGFQQPSYQPYQQHYPYQHQQHYQPLPYNQYQSVPVPSSQTFPQYNVPQYVPQQAPLIQEPLQAWPHINPPMSSYGGQPSSSSGLTSLESVTVPADAPGFQPNLVSNGSSSSKSKATSQTRSTRSQLNNALPNSVLTPATASPSLSGGVQVGQVLGGEVRSGTVLSGQYHPPTSLSPARQSPGNVFIEAPRPTNSNQPNSNQPFRHGW